MDSKRAVNLLPLIAVWHHGLTQPLLWITKDPNASIKWKRAVN